MSVWTWFNRTLVCAFVIVVVAADGAAAQSVTASALQAIDEEDLQLRPVEPDFSIVNLPTTLRLPRVSWNFRLTHRFLANLRQGSFTDHLDNLFGLDNGAIIGLELRFAPIRGLQAIVYRTNLDKTIQFSAQYSVLRQTGGSPIALHAIASIEGTNNFRSAADEPGGDGHDHGSSEGGHRSPAFGAVVSRTFGNRLAAYATPMWVHHTVALADGGHRDTSFVGLGGRLRISQRVYVVGEVSPRFSGFAPGDPEFAFGLERRAGGHMFQLTFTNSFGGTYGQIARGGLPDAIYFGFNMGRKFF
jgi:hypothetical protein